MQVSRIGPSAQISFGMAPLTEEGVDAVLPLLQRLAQESGHQELIDAPLLFWGHSGGAYAATRFASRFAERTVAFVRYNSGPTLQGDLSVLSRIPAVFFTGGKESKEIIDGTETAWKRGRALGAPWTFVINPDATHGNPNDLKKADQLLIPWITAVIRQRLSPKGDRLQAVPEGSAWIGNNRTGEVAPFGSFLESRLQGSWLPDEPSAHAWHAVREAAK